MVIPTWRMCATKSLIAAAAIAAPVRIVSMIPIPVKMASAAAPY